ncbi:MAG: hypothetical protein JSR30_00065 [Proteobacteria bacterium]|nr:hypothetical protein [Pseudomonadota bacterium]
MAPGLSDLIPGLREAEDSYRQANAEAFAGVEPDICGMVRILPLTPQMFIELDGAGNAFFAKAGTAISPADVAIFLWRVSPFFTREDVALRRLHTANSGILPYDRAVDEITAYIRRSWAGMPLWKRKAGGEGGMGQWPARLVHMFASEYGWTEEYILNLPFRRLWQYANRVLEEHDPKFREQSAEVMRLRQEWLIRANSGSN